MGENNAKNRLSDAFLDRDDGLLPALRGADKAAGDEAAVGQLNPLFPEIYTRALEMLAAEGIDAGVMEWWRENGKGRCWVIVLLSGKEIVSGG